MAELEQLALKSLVSPALILPGHTLDQRDYRVIDGWTPETAGIGPFLGDQAMMPAQDRARRDQAMPAQPRGQGPDQRGEHRAIRPVQARLLAERGIEADHITIYRWTRRFTPLLAEAARP